MRRCSETTAAPDENGFVAAFLLHGAMAPIGIGAWLGTIMLLNVWGVIWPQPKEAAGHRSRDRRGEGEGAPPRIPGIAREHDALDPDALLHGDGIYVAEPGHLPLDALRRGEHDLADVRARFEPRVRFGCAFERIDRVDERADRVALAEAAARSRCAACARSRLSPRRCGAAGSSRRAPRAWRRGARGRARRCARAASQGTQCGRRARGTRDRARRSRRRRCPTRRRRPARRSSAASPPQSRACDS